MEYESFLASKRKAQVAYGFDVLQSKLNRHLFDWQRRTVAWALKRGRAALFEGCGLGKTIQQLVWLEHVFRHTRKHVVLHTPVGIRQQTVDEAKRFGIGCDVAVVDKPSGIVDGINIINYEKMHLFAGCEWGGVALDESSILKSFTGATKRDLCERYRDTPYRLACTATPAPNDHMELGNHAEFLGVMPSNEMLSRWFINDTMKAGGYRLKGHAAKDFWRWVSTWAVCVSRPSDIGGDDTGYELPPLTIKRHYVAIEDSEPPPGFLFDASEITATSLYDVKRKTAEARVAKAVEIANCNEPVLIWCDTNDEADRLARAIPDAFEVRGTDSDADKDRMLNGFPRGECRVMITKPSIAGYGMNWQHCRVMIFAGLTFSFEDYYQAIRRCYRFGQSRPVQVHLVLAECDSALEKTIGRKENDHLVMQASMAQAMRESCGSMAGELARSAVKQTKQIRLPVWMQKENLA